MAIFNYQIFENVSTKEEFLSNIEQVATANGWICDKNDINGSGELYLHSNGNGSQNLYFSMKIADGYMDGIVFHIHGNTGFDSSLPWNAQPGKFTSYNEDFTNPYNFQPYLYFPLIRQYIFANSSNVLIFADMITSDNIYDSRCRNIRIIGHFLFGSIESYKSNETEGNLTLSWMLYPGKLIQYSMTCFTSALLGSHYTNFSDIYASRHVGLLYSGENKCNTSLGISTSFVDHFNCYYYNIGDSSYKYNRAVRFNNWESRTTLVKPIIFIKHQTDTDTYFWPIGELPYYACVVWPYSKAGDIVTFGTRKFMLFPLLRYENGNGVAVEIPSS